MKYVQPYGITDSDAPYINGNPSTGVQGSIPPAAAFEHPMRELVNTISKSVITPNETDLLQLAKAIRSQRLNYSEDTGGVNALICAYDPPIAAYTLGLVLHVKIRNTTTGATTINAGAGVVNVVRADGSAIQGGDLVANEIAALIYDGTRFQIVNYMGAGAGGGGGDITTYITKLPYAVDTSVTAGIITVTFTPAITALAAGDAILVKLANTLPGPTVINIDALAAVQLRCSGGPLLLQGDAIAGDVMFLRYDGTYFWFDPQPLITANVTLNCPTQYATPTAALTALKRKLISPGARVTIKLATQIWAPFTVDHHNANRITIQGTMIGAAPAWNTFAQQGPSPAQRAADSATNISMLRTRYGSEIQVPASTLGIQNVSGNAVTLQDLLITGPNFQGSGSQGVYGIRGNGFECSNVTCWGLDWGFNSQSSDMVCGSCHAVNNHAVGYYADGAGRISISGGSSGTGNTSHGIYANNHGIIGAGSSYFRCNGQYGSVSADHSHINLDGCDSSYSGTMDIMAYNLSEAWVRSLIGGSLFSPAPNTIGNNGSYLQLI